MQTTHIQLVQRTWKEIKPRASGAALAFYARLFDLDPSLRRIFPADLLGQAERFTMVLGSIVGSLDRVDTLLPAIELVGRRHADYGILSADYDTVGRALCETLADVLGEAWTPEVHAAWTETYATLAGVMRRASLELLAQRRTSAVAAAIASTIGKYGFSHAGMMAAFA